MHPKPAEDESDRELFGPAAAEGSHGLREVVREPGAVALHVIVEVLVGRIECRDGRRPLGEARPLPAAPVLRRESHLFRVTAVAPGLGDDGVLDVRQFRLREERTGGEQKNDQYLHDSRLVIITPSAECRDSLMTWKIELSRFRRTRDERQ